MVEKSIAKQHKFISAFNQRISVERMALNAGEETDLDKIAEDELARLQRQVNSKQLSHLFLT